MSLIEAVREVVARSHTRLTVNLLIHRDHLWPVVQNVSALLEDLRQRVLHFVGAISCSQY